jgi:hypothetical protein
VAAFTAISVAATVAAAKAVLRSNASVSAFRPHSMQCCDLSYQPHTAPANGQNAIAGEGRRDDRDTLKSGGPP